jgi:thioredoxin reductase
VIVVGGAAGCHAALNLVRANAVIVGATVVKLASDH